MSLHRLSWIEIGIPERALEATRAFYRDFGVVETAPGRFATSDGGEQLGLVAAPRRCLRALRVGVDDADDLGRAAAALAKLGVAAERRGGALVATEPVTGIRATLAVEPLAFAKPGHVLFGSDWPYAPAPAVAYFTGQLDAYAALDAAGHAAIDRANAEALVA